MELIKTENMQKKFTISISESDLGTIFLALGFVSNSDIKEHKNDYYSNLKYYTEDPLPIYSEIKKILEV